MIIHDAEKFTLILFLIVSITNQPLIKKKIKIRFFTHSNSSTYGLVYVSCDQTFIRDQKFLQKVFKICLGMITFLDFDSAWRI